MFRLTVFLFAILFAAPGAAVDAGDKAPRFTATLYPAQQWFDLETMRGQVVYLDFWASWCIPCIKSIPWLESLQQRYRSHGFQVIAVNLDENQGDAIDFLRDYDISFPVILDSGGVLSKHYKIPGMPTGFLIDRDGTVVKRHVGFRSGSVNDVARTVHELVTGNPP